MAATTTTMQSGIGINATMCTTKAVDAFTTSSGSLVVVTDSDIDVLGAVSICGTAIHTCTAASSTIAWFGANKSDFTDEFQVQSTGTIASGTNAAFCGTPSGTSTTLTGVARPPFRYYRCKCFNTGAAGNTTVTINWLVQWTR